MRITIHRGTREIGGSCVELEAQGKKLILDIGLPLVNQDGTSFSREQAERSVPALLGEGVLPKIDGLYDESSPCDVVGMVLSHAHLDHVGLAHHVRADVPIYATRGTQALTEVNGMIFGSVPRQGHYVTLPMWEPVQIGPFAVTAHLADHSAPDAVSIEVEAGGKKVFYSGDLRGHGRKCIVFENMLRRPPKNIDALLLEGSTLGRHPEKSAESCSDEKAVEEAFVKILRKKSSLALLICSSQNLDRIVSAFRAAQRCGNTLVIDLYTAYVLAALRPLSQNIPQFDWDGVRVFYWKAHCDILAKGGHAAFLQKAKSARIEMPEVKAQRRRIFMLAKSNSLLEIIARHVGDPEQIELIWSMWTGYLESGDVIDRFRAACNPKWHVIHTSGHATSQDLQRLVAGLNPKHLIPIHTFHPDEYGQFGIPVKRLNDGEVFAV